jgi:transposase-like protein
MICCRQPPAPGGKLIYRQLWGQALGHRFPAPIIRRQFGSISCVTLSYRDVAELLAERARGPGAD